MAQVKRVVDKGKVEKKVKELLEEVEEECLKLESGEELARLLSQIAMARVELGRYEEAVRLDMVQEDDGKEKE